MRIAITGHRPNKLGNDYNLTGPLIRSIRVELQIIIDKYKPTHIISGMALGIDTLWAQMALENNIPLIAAVPCLDQEKQWTPSSQWIYRAIINDPLTSIKWVSKGGYTYDCMHNRNIWMVDNCDLLVAVWDGTTGGTYNCIKYAESIDCEIIRINPIKL